MKVLNGLTKTISTSSMPAKTKRRVKPKMAVKSPHHVSQNRFLQMTQVYVMHNIPFFWLNKFGISDHSDRRRRNVSETTPGYVFYLVSPHLEFGWHLEKFIHALYRLQNVHFWTGSGRTEWFFVFSPVVGTLVMMGSVYWNIPLTWKWYVGAYFMPFVWWDGWFWLAVFWLARVIAWGAILLFFCWAIVHIK